MALEVIFEKHMNTEQKQFLVLVSSCLLKLCAGQIYAQVIYAMYIKAAFHMNQKELDTSLSMVAFGSSLMLLSGLFYDRFGSRLSILFGGLLSITLQIVVLVLLVYPQVIGGKIWVLCLFLFFYGHSFCYSYVAAIGTCMTSFPVHKRGLVMAMIDSSLAMALPLLAFIYYILMGFKDVRPLDQSPIGIYIFLILLNVFSHTFGFLFLSPVDKEYFAIPDTLLDDESPERTSSFPMTESTPILSGSVNHDTKLDGDDDNDSCTDENERFPPKSEEQTTVKQFVKRFMDTWGSLQFLPFFVAFVCLFSIQFTITMNITTMSRSLGEQSHDFQLLLIPSLLGVLFRFIICPLSDRYFPLAYQRLMLLVICSITLGTLSITLLSVPVQPWNSGFGILLSGLTLGNIQTAAMFTLVPIIISQLFSHEIFGQLYSSCIVLGVLCGLWLSIGFGAIYDSEATRSHEEGNVTMCLGYRCYIYGNLVGLFIHFVGIAFLIWYTLLIRKRTSRA